MMQQQHRLRIVVGGTQQEMAHMWMSILTGMQQAAGVCADLHVFSLA